MTMMNMNALYFPIKINSSIVQSVAVRLLAVLFLEGSHERHVRRHGVLLGHAFSRFPRVPLSLALKIKHTRSRRVHVTDVGLLKQPVEVEHLFLRRLDRMDGWDDYTTSFRQSSLSSRASSRAS